MKAHTWIPEILNDIKDYASANGLHDTARIIDQAFLVSKAEVDRMSSSKHLRLISDCADSPRQSRNRQTLP